MILKKILRHINVLFSNVINSKNHQKNLSYDEYVKLQLEKTLDPLKVSKWQNEEWEEKETGFIEIFKRHSEILKNLNEGILIGSRTGQEVKALQKFGLNSIGIDLAEFPPYTIKGDVHNIPFQNSKFDFAFTNIYDHILKPSIFAAELNRVLIINGVFILHLFLGHDIDKYSVNFVLNEWDVVDLFKQNGFKLLEKNSIKNLHDKMNVELIFKKNENINI